MGAVYSLQEKIQNASAVVSELAEPEESDLSNEGATPTRLPNKRLLTVDPRSPSASISRTPIVVDKTPMLPPPAGVRRVPGQAVDPRSPTTEFTRTPISTGLASERLNARLHCSDVPEAGSPTSTATSTESGIESADVTPVKNSVDGRGLESPDSALSLENLNLAEPGVTSETGNTSPPTSGSDADENTPLVIQNKEGGLMEEVTVLTPKLPVCGIRPQALSKLAENSSVTRSPLSSVGNSRPRVLMQQQKSRTPVQGLKVTDVSSSGSVEQNTTDKENCVH